MTNRAAESATYQARQDWFTESCEEVAVAFLTSQDGGLSTTDAQVRLQEFGPNAITAEKPLSIWLVALAQLRDPMNLMLVAVTLVSFVIGQVSAGFIVGLLILLDVTMGSRQELKARQCRRPGRPFRSHRPRSFGTRLPPIIHAAGPHAGAAVPDPVGS